MKWNQFRLQTTTQAEDIVSSMLMDLGIQGVQIEDKVPLTQADKEQMFVDILPEIAEDDGMAYLTFYLEEEEDKEKILRNVRKRTGGDVCAIWMWESASSRSPRQRMWTGSTTGSSISISSTWMIF
ncbi:MAG: 50S ribosomal protein L11 methyltransferase [[Clostridium] scindens]